MKDINGAKISCGDLITDGVNVYLVECVADGKVYTKKTETCEDNRFYGCTDNCDFTAAETAAMWRV